MSRIAHTCSRNQLFFMHFRANDDAKKLAETRAALDAIHVKK